MVFSNANLIISFLWQFERRIYLNKSLCRNPQLNSSVSRPFQLHFRLKNIKKLRYEQPTICFIIHHWQWPSSHFCRVEFNSVKCGRNATCRFVRRTCVAPNSKLYTVGCVGQRKMFKRRVFNMAGEGTEWWMTLILRKIVRQWNEKEKHWDQNGQVSSFCLAGPSLPCLMHRHNLWFRRHTVEIRRLNRCRISVG